MKRPNGTGSIVKLSGKRRRPYMVRISGRDKYGQVIQRPLSYHATVAEAQRALDEYNRNTVLGLNPQIDLLSTTVQQIYDRWSEREYKKLSAYSISNHRAAWNKRVSRYASCKIRDVTLDMWQSILDEDADNGLSSSVINNDSILIKALCAYAIKHDILSKDVSQYLDIPRVGPKYVRGTFTDIQIAQLEQMARDGFPWADTVLILCYTGLRISEFLSLTRFSYHPENGGYLQCGMKTEAGKNRIIPIHPKIALYLKRRLDESGDTIILHKGKPISGQWYREYAFQPIAKKLGCPEATPHWCRHTFATRLHAANADPLTTKWLLGHSTKGDVTARYTHKTIEVLKRELLKLA